MLIVLDADGIIKLNRAGTLSHVVEAFDCTVPLAVYNEVVTEGKAHKYQDAEAIEAALASKAEIPSIEARREPELALGTGERAILSFIADRKDTIVVSDDRRFLTVLSAQRAAFLTPADMLVVLARRGPLTKSEAGEALERLRPAIRTKAYWEAREDLGYGRGNE